MNRTVPQNTTLCLTCLSFPSSFYQAVRQLFQFLSTGVANVPPLEGEVGLGGRETDRHASSGPPIPAPAGGF